MSLLWTGKCLLLATYCVVVSGCVVQELSNCVTAWVVASVPLVCSVLSATSRVELMAWLMYSGRGCRRSLVGVSFHWEGLTWKCLWALCAGLWGRRWVLSMHVEDWWHGAEFDEHSLYVAWGHGEANCIHVIVQFQCDSQVKFACPIFCGFVYVL